MRPIRTTSLAIAGIVAVAVVGGWVAWSPPVASDRPQPAVAAVPGSGPLDGMTFAGELGPVDAPPDVKDNFVFANGKFVSVECERRCNYPASPYFARRVGKAVEFVVESRCPDKDATMVWRGRVKDGTVSGVYTWTVRRWYWTIEKDFRFSGKLVAARTPVADGR